MKNKNKSKSVFILINTILLILIIILIFGITALNHTNHITNKSNMSQNIVINNDNIQNKTNNNKTNTQEGDKNIKIYTIRGNSLNPYLKDGDEIKVDLNYYNHLDPRRYDTIVYNFSARDQLLIKYIGVIPKDNFSIKNNKLYVNNQEFKNILNQTYILNTQNQKMLELYEKSFEGKMPENTYFIFSIRSGEIDSGKFGPVNKDKIIGKVMLD
jgi:signal peptidase I